MVYIELVFLCFVFGLGIINTAIRNRTLKLEVRTKQLEGRVKLLDDHCCNKFAIEVFENQMREMNCQIDDLRHRVKKQQNDLSTIVYQGTDFYRKKYDEYNKKEDK